LIQKDLRSEQATNRLEIEDGLRISHEIIYQHIYSDKRNDGELHQHLRSQKSLRMHYASGQERRGTIKNHDSIDEHPEIVVEKKRMGD